MKSRVIILVSVIFFIFNLVFAEDPGPPKAKKWKGARKSSRVTLEKKYMNSPNFAGISKDVQKMLPHTENLKKILGFFNVAC